MTPPTYPLRPSNGGPPDKMRPKPQPEKWIYEPKFNGWRAIVHAPTGRMFNRKLEPLSIEAEFATVLDALRAHYAENPRTPEWIDCEALERRHNKGRGSLILLDYIPTSPADPTPLHQRQQTICEELASVLSARFYAFEHEEPPENSLLVISYHYSTTDSDPDMDPAAACARLQKINRTLGCEFFEGVVAKHLDSLYPHQLRSPEQSTPFWIKHRWKF